MKKVLALTMALVFSMASLVPAGDLPTLRVAVQPYLLSVPTYYIIKNGLDVKNGFKIESSIYVNGTLINEALGANLWDLALNGPSTMFGVANYGSKVIANISLSSGGLAALVRKDSPVAQIKDKIAPNLLGDAATLKGAKVLVPVGTINQWNVLKWIEKAGLTADDVEFVHMDNSSAFQAFKAGSGDIVAFSPPLSFVAEYDEGWVVGATGPELGMYFYDTVATNPRTYEQKKDVIVKYIKLMYEVGDMFIKDPELIAQTAVAFQKENGATISIENARREVAARHFVSSEQAKTMPVGEGLNDMAQFFVSTGSLEEEQAELVREGLIPDIIKMVFPDAKL